MAEFLWFLGGVVIGVALTYWRQRGRIEKYRAAVRVLRQRLDDSTIDVKQGVKDWLYDIWPL